MEGASSYISEMVSTSVNGAQGSQVTCLEFIRSMDPKHVFPHIFSVCVCDPTLFPDIESNQLLPDADGDDQAGTGVTEPLKPGSRAQIVNFTHQHQHLARDGMNLHALAYGFDLVNK